MMIFDICMYVGTNYKAIQFLFIDIFNFTFAIN